MKNFIFYLLLSSAIGLISCNTEEGPIPGANLQLSVDTDVEFQSINDTIPLMFQLTDDVNPFSQSLQLKWNIDQGDGFMLKNGNKVNASDNSISFREDDQFAFLSTQLGDNKITFTIQTSNDYTASDDITLDIKPNRKPVVNILSHEFYVGEKLPNPDELYTTTVDVTIEAFDLDGVIVDISYSNETYDDVGTFSKLTDNTYKINAKNTGRYNKTDDTYSTTKPGDTITITVTDNDGDSTITTFTLGQLDKSSIE